MKQSVMRLLLIS